MNPTGYFTFVLHSHIPYVRMSGRWPHGEEILYEAMAETYIPLLSMLYDLKKEKVQPKLTIGLTPILVEQLADRYLNKGFVRYVKERLKLAKAEEAFYKKNPDPKMDVLIQYNTAFYEKVLSDYEKRFNSDIIGAFRDLQDLGNLDIVSSAATHGYLPLFEKDTAVIGQLVNGRKAYQKAFGKAPSGIWLPECGYKPEYKNGHGVEHFLEELGYQYFFTDTHTITEAGHEQIASHLERAFHDQGAFGMQYFAKRRAQSAHRMDESVLEAESNETHRPYYVAQSHVAALGRDEPTGMLVWSADWGYPGDFLYRDFHRKSDKSGLRYHKISNNLHDLSKKDLYDPAQGQARALEHARHFVDTVVANIENQQMLDGYPNIIVSSYDTELFGHWWYEGITWLKEVMRLFSKQTTVELTTAANYVKKYPPTENRQLPESSWGNGGSHYTWYNDETAWMWPIIHDVEDKMEEVANKYGKATGETKKLVQQLAREALLLQSSDWPFLISTGQAADYAKERFMIYVERFHFIYGLLDQDTLSEADRAELAKIRKEDNPFSEVDVKPFKAS